MAAANYQSLWWGYIYDQMMAELPDWVENNRSFYRDRLRSVRGQVLECACGTGIMLLHLMEAGFDMFGFDISEPMLDTLRRRAAAQGIQDIAWRVSVMDLETFRYDRQFEAVIIPTNSFNVLTTQEAQIRALRNIHAHLVPGGRLLLDLTLPGMRRLVETPEVEEGNWYTWTHPETGLPIRQRVVGRLDFNRQLVLDRCFIEYEGQAEDFPMTGRWTFKSEFELLLRLAGFAAWECYGSPAGAPLELGLDDQPSYWVATR